MKKLVAQKTPARKIIIEGPIKNTDLKGFSTDKLRLCILTIHMKWQIQVIMSQSLADTVNWIHLLVEFRKNRQPVICPNYRSVSRPFVGLGRFRRQHDSGPLPLQMKALARIPGLGQAKASSLLELFGSIHQIRTRRIRDLTQVEGIGTKLAERILGYLE